MVFVVEDGFARTKAGAMPTLLEKLPPARPAELHAATIAQEVSGNHILATTVGRGQAAITLAEARPDAEVNLWFHDQYQQQLLVSAVQDFPAQLGLYCEADAPAITHEGQYDLAVIPVFKSGEAEFTRDVLQAAFQALGVGGQLVAAIDNPQDKWLRSHLAATGETVRVRPDTSEKPKTVCYIVRKNATVKKSQKLRVQDSVP